MTDSIKRDYSLNKKECDRRMHCDCGKNMNCAKDDVLSPCPKGILIECGIPGSETSFFTTGQTTNTTLVTVDVSCFIKPVVDIRFSNEISVILQPDDGVTPPGTAEVVLRYDLMCRPDGGSETAVGSWTYKRLLTANTSTTTPTQRLETTDTFSFNKCLFPKPCNGCIDYFVKITAITISVNNEII
ncbi:DUF4489 domain-containing protein [Wukongibacter baidiensis]|uniref:DUF4489 domain-containing protein n=1 Tax=Wukongibacter baidiensis TaxID=1723361 RepID=UPI003D7FD3FE